MRLEEEGGKRRKKKSPKRKSLSPAKEGKERKGGKEGEGKENSPPGFVPSVTLFSGRNLPLLHPPPGSLPFDDEKPLIEDPSDPNSPLKRKFERFLSFLLLHLNLTEKRL